MTTVLSYDILHSRLSHDKLSAYIVSRGEIEMLNGSSENSHSEKQVDILLAGYAAQRADCSAVFSNAVSFFGGTVAFIGVTLAFVQEPEKVPAPWLCVMAVVPWALLSYHSLLVGMNAAHSYVCEVYERELAAESPRVLVYEDERPYGESARGKILLGSSVGELFLDPNRASRARRFATYYSLVLLCALTLCFSLVILTEIYARNRIAFLASSVAVGIGVAIVVINFLKDLHRPEVQALEKRGVLRQEKASSAAMVDE